MDASKAPQPSAPKLGPGTLLRVRKIWVMPAVLAGILISLISLIYVGSVVNPTAHLRDLPVLIVNQDKGATVAGKQVDVGSEIASAMSGSPDVTDRLALRVMSLQDAQHRMDHGKAFATIVIPPDFSGSLATLFGLGTGTSVTVPTVTILTNQRLGSLGTSLASGVAEPALTKIGQSVAQTFTKQAPAATNGAVTALRAQPIMITNQSYRPLPNHSALGLSAFYIALLTLMCGFLGGTITNSSLDSATGFAPTEIGPKWRLRRPLPLRRRQTLLTKWIVAAVIVPFLVGIMLAISVGVLHVYAPNVLYLWLFASFAAITVAFGTLVLFAIFGSLGQLLAMIGFLYLSLASSGGTIPLDALPGPLRWAGEIEPLRQILGAVRSIIYFDLSFDSGLGRGLLMTGIGLALWLIVGLVATSFYDRKGLARISPEALAYVNRSLARLKVEQTAAEADQARPKAAGSDRASWVS